MKKVIRLTESDLHKMIKESVNSILNEGKKQKSHRRMNEHFHNGEPNDTEINSPEDGSRTFRIGIWPGSGYILETFIIHQDNDDAMDALEKVVAYLDKQNDTHLFIDDWVEKEKQELVQKGIDEEEIYNQIDEYAIYVDATMYGAKTPHYIFSENLKIAEIKTPMREHKKRK